MERFIIEILPGGRSRVSGVYELRDAFGMPTITKLFILQGREAPTAPQGFKWRLIGLPRKSWWAKPLNQWDEAAG
jgi:hypothetical protein